MYNNINLDEFFKKNHERIENNISDEYHKRIKQIKIENSDERNNIKMSIISELYYKEGFKDGLNYIIKILDKK